MRHTKKNVFSIVSVQQEHLYIQERERGVAARVAKYFFELYSSIVIFPHTKFMKKKWVRKKKFKIHTTNIVVVVVADMLLSCYHQYDTIVSIFQWAFIIMWTKILFALHRWLLANICTRTLKNDTIDSLLIVRIFSLSFLCHHVQIVIQKSFNLNLCVSLILFTKM